MFTTYNFIYQKLEKIFREAFLRVWFLGFQYFGNIVDIGTQQYQISDLLASDI